MDSHAPPPEIFAVAWQQEFVSKFVSQPHSRSLLVAASGTGKTTTALFAANKMLEDGTVDSILVISDRVMLRDQWRDVASRYGMELEKSLENQLGRDGVSTTLQALRSKNAETIIDATAKARRWLIIGDDPAYETKSLIALVDRMLRANNESRALFIARHVPSDLSFEAEFTFNTEFILDRRIIQERSTQIRVARFSPSFALLRELQRRPAVIDGLSWRQFEKLIATLLESDGYTVELMQGSKDGGVDVMAVKDLGTAGYFKTLWQAKKQNVKNKVGISVVRELADTRQEFRASKGIIVTSSYLTRGALERIERDKYILGKVDREDLNNWIRKTLFGQKDS